MIERRRYVLGLSIGTGSIGWAALTLDGDGRPDGLLDAGVRVFPAGTIGDIQSGRDESRNARRQAAHARRTHVRRTALRLRRVFRMLQDAGLLPIGGASPEARDCIIKQIDKDAAGLAIRDDVPYALRARALDERPLSAHQLGRVIYHIAQRRGYQSSRRCPERDEEQAGVVARGISDLDAAIAASGARTLGEYLHKQHEGTAPVSGRAALRRRWTSRAMYRAELAAIFAAQAPHHAVLTDKWCAALTRLLFEQRPLKSQAARIGRCELERDRRRMPLAALDAQEFRLLQRVNDLRVTDDVGVEPIALTTEQRQKLVAVANQIGDVSFTQIRKLLELPKTARFTHERVNERAIVGNRTAARIGGVLGVAAWTLLPPGEQQALVTDLVCIEEEEGLVRRLRCRYGLDEAAARRLAAMPLEPGYLSHSHRAVTKLLPWMRAGEPYATAKKRVYDKAEVAPVRPAAPSDASDPLRMPIHLVYPYLPPLVGKALAEVRTLVRALCREYGAPMTIRVQLLRELRIGRKARELAARAAWARNREREKAAARMLQDMGVQDAAPWMIEKILLAEECGWVCPYTGKTISIRALCGGEPQFVIAHILPLHRTLDDAFVNKTLCHVSAAPVAQSGTRGADAVALARFDKLTGSFAKEKRKRAGMTDMEIEQLYGGELLAAHFVDSCRAATVTADYLRRVAPITVTRGPITGYVRDVFGLGRIGDGFAGDHRRHAVTAVCVALSDLGVVGKLARAALSAPPGTRKRFAQIDKPWEGFYEAVRNRAEQIIPSHRVRTKVSGPLHEESVYRREPDGSYTIRKALSSLSRADVERIASPRVLAAVAAALGKHGDAAEPRKVFALDANLPRMSDGHVVRACRVKRAEEPFVIGANGAARYVTTEENHHIAIVTDERGRWEREVVNHCEAQRRLRAGEIVVRTGGSVVGSLAVGETFELNGEGVRVARAVGKEPRVSHVSVTDARPLKAIIEAKALGRDRVEQLRRAGFRKVRIDTLGRLRKA